MWLFFFISLSLTFIDSVDLLEVSVDVLLLAMCVSCHFVDPSLKIDSLLYVVLQKDVYSCGRFVHFELIFIWGI